MITIEELQFLNFTQDVLDRRGSLQVPLISSVDFELKEFLYTFWPSALAYFDEVKTGRSTVLNKPEVTVLLDAVRSHLQQHRVLSAVVKTALVKLKDIKSKPEVIENYLEVITSLHKTYYRKLEGDDKKLFYAFYKYANAEYDDKVVKYIMRNRMGLPKPLIQYLGTVKLTDTRVEDEYKITSQRLQKVNTKYFQTDTPSFDQQKQLRDTNPEAYKKYRELYNAARSVGKQVLEEAWITEGYDIVDVKKARALCNKIGVPCSIDPGYIGKVSLGKTDAVQFIYYTVNGKQLESTPGVNVTMNPNYTSADNSYYCKAIPASQSTDKVYSFYTIDYVKNRTDRLFQKARECADNVEAVRIQYEKDIVGKNKVTAMCAVLVKLMDLTAGRIGSTAQEKNDPPTYGLSILRGKHLKVEANRCVLSYLGKDAQQQRHVVTDVQMVKTLAALKRKVKANDYLFSITEGKPVSNTTIRKYLNSVGFENPHVFRKLAANRILSEQTKKFKNKAYALKGFKEIADKIADTLGNTPSVAVSAYCAPTLIQNFMDLNGLELSDMPASVKKQFNGK